MIRSKNNRGYLNYIHDYYTNLEMHEISLVFEGQVTHPVMKTLTNLMEEQLEESQENEIIRRRVYHVMVESLQNINRHADAVGDPEHQYPGRGLLLVDKQEDSYNVTTGNIVNKYQVEELSLFLGKINNLDNEGLDDMYKSQLQEGQISLTGGAGLGFIDIRRKTGHPLNYRFITIDDNTFFFVFTSKISR